MKVRMKHLGCLAALIVVFASVSANAQATADAKAPAGSTGKCNDGTYTTAAKKSGACSGHKGVATWYAGLATAPGSKPAAPAPANAASPAGSNSTSASSSPKPSSSPASNKSQAQGGGPGMVWVNTASKVYHCPGTEYYGKTKQGKYLSEADAVAMGARPDHGKPCPK